MRRRAARRVRARRRYGGRIARSSNYALHYREKCLCANVVDIQNQINEKQINTKIAQDIHNKVTSLCFEDNGNTQDVVQKMVIILSETSKYTCLIPIILDYLIRHSIEEPLKNFETFVRTENKKLSLSYTKSLILSISSCYDDINEIIGKIIVDFGEWTPEFVKCKSNTVVNHVKNRIKSKQTKMTLSIFSKMSENAYFYEEDIKEKILKYKCPQTVFTNIISSGTPSLVEYILSNKLVDLKNKNLIDLCKTKCKENGDYIYKMDSQKMMHLLDNGYQITNSIWIYILEFYDISENILEKLDPLIFNEIILKINTLCEYDTYDQNQVVLNNYAKLMKIFPLSNYVFTVFLHRSPFFLDYFKYMTERPGFQKFDEDQIKIIAGRLRYDYVYNYKITDYLKFDLTENNVCYLLKSGDKRMSEYFLKVKTKIHHTPKVIQHAYFHPDLNKNLISYLLAKKLKFTPDCFDSVCTTGDPNIVYEHGFNNRIPIISEHFRKVVSAKIYTMNELDSREGPYYEISKLRQLNCVEILFKLGYRMTYSDLEFVIKNKCIIDNIERFNIPTNYDTFRLCCQYQCFPTSYFEDVPNNQVELFKLLIKDRASVKKTKLDEVKEFYKKEENKDLVPDTLCMEFVCELNSNFNLYKFLKSKGGVPNDQCMINLSGNLSGSFIWQLKHDVHPEKYTDDRKFCLDSDEF